MGTWSRHSIGALTMKNPLFFLPLLLIALTLPISGSALETSPVCAVCTDGEDTQALPCFEYTFKKSGCKSKKIGFPPLTATVWYAECEVTIKPLDPKCPDGFENCAKFQCPKKNGSDKFRITGDMADKRLCEATALAAACDYDTYVKDKKIDATKETLVCTKCKPPGGGGTGGAGGSSGGVEAQF